MNILARRAFLLAAAAAAAALAPLTASEAQSIITPLPKGGLIPSGPYSMAPRGPNGEVISGPGGSAVRGPNSGVAPADGGVTEGAPDDSRPPTVPHRANGATTGHAFYYRGRTYYAVYAPAFSYPQGMAYRRWAVGAVLPAGLLTRAYPDYASLGLPRPPSGQRWVRYGRDLLLVDTHTGAVVHAARGAFEER